MLDNSKRKRIRVSEAFQTILIDAHTCLALETIFLNKTKLCFFLLLYYYYSQPYSLLIQPVPYS